MLELWKQALEETTGICIITDNRKLLQQHLYRARVEAKDPELEQLVIILPEDESELWLVHKDADSIGTNSKGDLKLVR
jgi:hypothetical protein